MGLGRKVTRAKVAARSLGQAIGNAPVVAVTTSQGGPSASNAIQGSLLKEKVAGTLVPVLVADVEADAELAAGFGNVKCVK